MSRHLRPASLSVAIDGSDAAWESSQPHIHDPAMVDKVRRLATCVADVVATNVARWEAAKMAVQVVEPFLSAEERASMAYYGSIHMHVAMVCHQHIITQSCMVSLHLTFLHCNSPATLVDPCAALACMAS